MRTILFRRVALVGALASLTACPAKVVECIDGTEEVCETGALPSDFCNSSAEAESDATNCHLTVTTGGAAPVRKQEVFLSTLSDGGVDQDWYFAQLPGGLTARSLLHINGGYQAPQTAVSFSVNILKQGASGLASVVAAVDRHGAAAPKPVDIIVPFGESNAKLYALVSDEGASGQPRVDNRNPYSLYMEIIENPDINEPNDTAATPITLTAMGATQQGSQTGYLATNDDVDMFSFQVPSAGAQQIIYLHILGPNPHPTNPPPPFRLAYTLFDPSDRPLAGGEMENEFLRIDLSTANLAPMSGTYKVKVNGYKEANSLLPVRGDLRVQYSVEVHLLPDLDTNEPNDQLTTAKAVNLTPNSTMTFTGKLSYITDEEWFSVSLPSRGSPSTFRYRLTALTGGGRFEPLSGTPARQLRVVRPVTVGATAQDRLVACRTNATACPKSADGDLMLVDEVCKHGDDPPHCLFSQRNEELPRITMLRNMVGAVPVEPGQATQFFVMFHDEGIGRRKYADDRDWTLELEWRDDPDEAARLGGPTVIGLSGATSVAQGELTFGYGKSLEASYFDSSTGLRGRNDYDAYDTDKDLFQFNFGGAMGDQSWEVSWELLHADGGSPPGDIALELTFCNGGPTTDGGLCIGAQQRIFAFNDSSLTPWYLPQSESNGRMLFTKQKGTSSTTFTAMPVGCWCFSGPRTAAGSYFANIAAIHRTSNDPLRYRVSQRIFPYPANFTQPDGGSGTCPVTDAGCQFAR